METKKHLREDIDLLSLQVEELSDTCRLLGKSLKVVYEKLMPGVDMITPSQIEEVRESKKIKI